MTDEIPRSDVIAFRLHAHHLTERLDNDKLLEAAGACGVQNSPPGSALLALHARVRDVTTEQVQQAVAGDKSLLQTWSLRGAPFFFPTADAPVFTTGVLPPTEAALRHFLPGVDEAVRRLGLSLTEAVQLAGAEIRDVLSGRRLAITELGIGIADRIAAQLPERQRQIWETDGPYAPNQPLGEAVVHFCIRILTLQRIVCFAQRVGNQALFVLVDEWLGHPIPDVDPALARAELLRRYLRCYGPSTRSNFAAWLGVRPGDTDPWWNLIEDELTQVRFGGPSWILTDDLDALRHPPTPRGVRLLPPRDPFTQMRDRDTIIDRRSHRQVWRPVGEPGTILVDGRIAGIWRPRKTSRTLTITVNPFDSLPDETLRSLQDEAQHVARLRGASAANLVIDRP